VALPQSGLVVEPGTRDLLETAVQAGAEVVGGLDPAGYDGDPVEHLDAVFGIAAAARWTSICMTRATWASGR
jgi:cytosine deaminase